MKSKKLNKIEIPSPEKEIEMEEEVEEEEDYEIDIEKLHIIEEDEIEEPSKEDVIEYANYLGFDLEKYYTLSYEIAYNALICQLPENINRAIYKGEGEYYDKLFYIDIEEGRIFQTSPLDILAVQEYMKRLNEIEEKNEKKKGKKKENKKKKGKTVFESSEEIEDDTDNKNDEEKIENKSNDDDSYERFKKNEQKDLHINSHKNQEVFIPKENYKEAINYGRNYSENIINSNDKQNKEVISNDEVEFKEDNDIEEYNDNFDNFDDDKEKEIEEVFQESKNNDEFPLNNKQDLNNCNQIEEEANRKKLLNELEEKYRLEKEEELKLYEIQLKKDKIEINKKYNDELNSIEKSNKNKLIEMREERERESNKMKLKRKEEKKEEHNYIISKYIEEIKNERKEKTNNIKMNTYEIKKKTIINELQIYKNLKDKSKVNQNEKFMRNIKEAEDIFKEKLEISKRNIENRFKRLEEEIYIQEENIFSKEIEEIKKDFLFKNEKEEEQFQSSVGKILDDYNKAMEEEFDLITKKFLKETEFEYEKKIKKVKEEIEKEKVKKENFYESSNREIQNKYFNNLQYIREEYKIKGDEKNKIINKRIDNFQGLYDKVKTKINHEIDIQYIERIFKKERIDEEIFYLIENNSIIFSQRQLKCKIIQDDIINILNLHKYYLHIMKEIIDYIKEKDIINSLNEYNHNFYNENSYKDDSLNPKYIIEEDLKNIIKKVIVEKKRFFKDNTNTFFEIPKIFDLITNINSCKTIKNNISLRSNSQKRVLQQENKRPISIQEFDNENIFTERDRRDYIKPTPKEMTKEMIFDKFLTNEQLKTIKTIFDFIEKEKKEIEKIDQNINRKYEKLLLMKEIVFDGDTYVKSNSYIDLLIEDEGILKENQELLRSAKELYSQIVSNSRILDSIDYMTNSINEHKLESTFTSVNCLMNEYYSIIESIRLVNDSNLNKNELNKRQSSTDYAYSFNKPKSQNTNFSSFSPTNEEMNKTINFNVNGNYLKYSNQFQKNALFTHSFKSISSVEEIRKRIDIKLNAFKRK